MGLAHVIHPAFLDHIGKWVREGSANQIVGPVAAKLKPAIVGNRNLVVLIDLIRQSQCDIGEAVIVDGRALAGVKVFARKLLAPQRRKVE